MMCAAQRAEARHGYFAWNSIRSARDCEVYAADLLESNEVKAAARELGEADYHRVYALIALIEWAQS